MATIQYERDLRSGQKATKRRKDSAIKWSYGERPLPGDHEVSGDGKARPKPKGSLWKPVCLRPVPKETAPMVLSTELYYQYKLETVIPYKPSVSRNRTTAASKLPSSRVPAETDVDAACSEMDLLGSPRRRSGQGTVLSIPAEASETAVAAARGILLYGTDATDAPAPALSLGDFAKPNVRATEKLVKKEYEVLDTNGDAIKGRKARQVLRRETGVAAPTAPTLLDDEEFELV